MRALAVSAANQSISNKSLITNQSPLIIVQIRALHHK